MENTNTRLYYFKTKSAFLTYKEQNRFPNGAIAFIESPKSIYTHGQYWDGSDVSTAIQNALTNIDTGGIKDGTVLGTIDGKTFKFGDSITTNGKTYTAGQGINIDGTTISQKEASSTSLGGIKLGYPQYLKNYPVELDGYNRAYVNVPWTPAPEAKDGGHWDNIYCNTATEIAPSLPANGANTNLGQWDHAIVDDRQRPFVWMATRWVSGDGNVGNWQGPWRISGADGKAGIDGDEFEYIYTRTIQEEKQQCPALTNSQSDDYVPTGWTDDPQGVTKNMRFEWMAFRKKHHTESNPTGTWSEFVGPVLWSAYGRTGTDGAGVEYIFYVGTDYPVGTQDPTTWTNDPGFGADEYIRANSGWTDNPVNLDNPAYGQGYKQWVSIRKYKNEVWGSYSVPSLWAYYPKDGDAGIGIVADLDNDMMAVPTTSEGMNYEFNQSAKLQLFDGVSEITGTASIESITDSAGNSVSLPSGSSITASGQMINVVLAANALDFDNIGQISVKCKIISTQNPEIIRYDILQIIGFSFGEDGVSYALSTSNSVIRHTKDARIIPASISVTCKRTRGITPLEAWVPSTIESVSSINGGHLEFRCKEDNNTAYKLTNDSVSTTNIAENIEFQLWYVNGNTEILVDREVVYVIEDGDNGISPVVYTINVKRSTLRKFYTKTGAFFEGGVFFDVVRSEGTSTQTITNTTEGINVQVFAGGTGGRNIPVSYDQGGWLGELIAVSWNDSYKFTQISVYDNEVLVASVVVPTIIEGKDGTLQSLTYAVTRIRKWVENANPVWNNGTEAEDGVYFIDIAIWDGSYWACKQYGTTERPSATATTWKQIVNEGSAAYDILVSNYIDAASITADQIIVTGNVTSGGQTLVRPVAGMLNSDGIPTEYNASNTQSNGVRIFAGPVANNGDVSDTAFNVRANGDMYVGKNGNNRSNQFLADGSGFVASGNIKWDSDGKLMINASDWTSVLDGDPAKTIGNYIAIHRVGYTGPRVSGANNMQATFTMYRSGIVAGMYHVSFIGPEYPETPGGLETFWGNGGVARLWSYIEPKIKLSSTAKNTFKLGDTVNIEVQDYRIHGIRVLTYVASPNNIATDSIQIPTVEGLIDGGSYTTTWSN